MIKYRLKLLQEGRVEDFYNFEHLKEFVSDYLSEWNENMPTREIMYKISKASGSKKLNRIFKNTIDLKDDLYVEVIK